MTHEQNLSIKDIKLYILRIIPQAVSMGRYSNCLKVSFYLGFVKMSFHSYSPHRLRAGEEAELRTSVLKTKCMISSPWICFRIKHISLSSFLGFFGLCVFLGLVLGSVCRGRLVFLWVSSMDVCMCVLCICLCLLKKGKKKIQGYKSKVLGGRVAACLWRRTSHPIPAF